MKTESILKPHEAPMDSPLLILEGLAIFTIDAEDYSLSAGESMVLPKATLHGVYPITNVKFILIK
jgi:quercetin dioxygenase-like cupin family protein